MTSFIGQKILVTGASGSIGAEVAKILHNMGGDVVISGTNLEKLNLLRAELGDERCTIHACDLSDLSACEQMIESMDKIDVLVCNAGITADALSMMMQLEKFQKVIDINLTASFILNKGAIKKMIKARYGRIVNISSVVGFTGNPGQANYCASKAGIVAMSKSMALEVASRGVTINCVAPGFIESNMTDKLTEEQKERIKQRIPAGRFGLPEDIAHSVAFLASKASSYINGQTIHVNGGMAML